MHPQPFKSLKMGGKWKNMPFYNPIGQKWEKKPFMHIVTHKRLPWEFTLPPKIKQSYDDRWTFLTLINGMDEKNIDQCFQNNSSILNI